MARLGVPDEYEVSIVSSRDTNDVLAILPFSNASWSRLRNAASAGSAVIPNGMSLTAPFGGLRPWDHALYIERNNAHVWSGPITGWSRTPDNQLTITASDASILFSKRLVGATRIYATTDANGNVTVPGNLVNLLQSLFSDALIGTTYDPFPIFRPTFVPDSYSGVPGGAPVQIYYGVPTGRELQVTRLERVSDVLQEFITAGQFFYTMIGSFLFVNEYAVRGNLSQPDLLSHATLSEQVVMDVPRIEVNGIDLTTRGFVGGSNSGANGHPVIGKFESYDASAWAYIASGYPPYVTSTLEAGRASTSPSSLNDSQDFRAEAASFVATVATPSLTIEQVQLSPNFSHPNLLPDLSNLLPGVRFIVNFDDPTPFLVPVSETKQVIRPGANTPSEASLWSGSVEHVRLDQLEVDVAIDGNGRLTETVKASLTPTVQWPVTAAGGKVVN